jgi:hypothetical protein
MKGGETMRTKDLTLALLAVFAVISLAPAAHAFTAPAAGDFMYDVYDIFVNKIMLGAVGFTAGVASIVFAAIMLVKAQFMLALPAVIGGAVLLKADAIVTSLGAII